MQPTVIKGIVHHKIVFLSLYLLTYILSQTCINFFILLNINSILKKVENQTVSGPQWLTQYFFFSIKVNVDQQQFGFPPSSKYLLLYSAQDIFAILPTPTLTVRMCLFTRIIRDPASPTEEVSTRFLNESLQIAFSNNVLMSTFQDECG